MATITIAISSRLDSIQEAIIYLFLVAEVYRDGEVYGLHGLPE